MIIQNKRNVSYHPRYILEVQHLYYLKSDGQKERVQIRSSSKTLTKVRTTFIFLPTTRQPFPAYSVTVVVYHRRVVLQLITVNNSRHKSSYHTWC